MVLLRLWSYGKIFDYLGDWTKILKYKINLIDEKR